MKNKYFIVVFLYISIFNAYSQTDYKEVYNNAIDNINKENYYEAIKLLQSIQDKNDYMIFYNLGYCYYQLENDELTQN